VNTTRTIEELEERIRILEAQLERYKRMEEALVRLAVIVRDSNDAITVQSFDGDIAAWNKGAERMYGFREEEALKMNIRDILPEDRREEALELSRRILDGETIDSFETQRLTKDGRILDVWLTATALKDEVGKPISIATTERDITQRKKDHEELQRHSDRMKLFAYSVIHDLKSPSIGVYGLAQLLKQQCGRFFDEKGRAYCEQIIRSTEQIAALTEKVNVYMSTQENPLCVESFGLKEMLKTLKDEFSTQIRLRQIEWVYPDFLPVIRADRISIIRALRNLVDNALKYGGENLSKIEFGYRISAEFHEISIADNGVGIEAEDCDTLFLPFARKLSSAKVEGAGLGLAIVKEVAELHGGKVWSRTTPGTGVTFCMAISRNL
jgi:PAS domain S-box-containing protein